MFAGYALMWTSSPLGLSGAPGGGLLYKRYGGNRRNLLGVNIHDLVPLRVFKSETTTVQKI